MRTKMTKAELKQFYARSWLDAQRLLAKHEAEFVVDSAQSLLDKTRISAFCREQIAKMHEAVNNAS